MTGFLLVGPTLEIRLREASSYLGDHCYTTLQSASPRSLGAVSGLLGDSEAIGADCVPEKIVLRALSSRDRD